MKILYSCFSQSWGGMEMFAVDAAAKLQERNIEVEFLCYPNSKIFHEAKKKNLLTHTFKIFSYVHPIQILRLGKLLKHKKYDVIHTQFSKDLWCIVPALQLFRLNIPLILTKQLGSFIIKKDILHQWIYKRVTLALGISKIIEKNLADTTPLSAEKIRLLHNGVDTEKFNPEKYDSRKIRNEFFIKDDEIVIGMLARLSSGKGHEEFIESAKLLLEKYHNVKFLIVGEASRGEDEYAATIQQMAKNILGEKVIFTGFRKDVPEVLAAMDIFVFPSRAEAFGIALVEAFAMAKPTVCANADGILDIATDRVDCYFFEPKNATDLFHKIEMLLQSPEKQKQFGIAARKKAVQKFDITILTNNIIKIYEEVKM